LSIFIIAQVIGFIGYIFYISAPHLKTQKTIMQFGAVAYILLGVQWYMLDQHALLMVNTLGLLLSTAALEAQHNKRTAKLLPLFYPIGFCAFYLTAQGTAIDIICMLSFCFCIASKSSKEIVPFRFYAILSGILLTIAGAMALCLPALLFNFMFTAAHFQKILPAKKSLILATN